MARWEITHQGNKTIVTKKHPVLWGLAAIVMVAAMFTYPYLLLSIPIALGMVYLWQKNKPKPTG